MKLQKQLHTLKAPEAQFVETVTIFTSDAKLLLEWQARCAFDVSKTQTKLVSAIGDPFLEASWEQFSSKLAPSAGHALCLWSRPRSLVTPTFPGHACLRRPLSQITPTCRWSCHLSLVTPTVAGQTQKSLHPTRCVQFDVLCTSRAQRNARSD